MASYILYGLSAISFVTSMILLRKGSEIWPFFFLAMFVLLPATAFVS
jgi:hypothetical protein